MPSEAFYYPFIIGNTFFNEPRGKKMSNKSFSKLDMRSVFVVFTVAIMAIASFGLNTVDGATSPVTLTADKSKADIMEGEFVIVTLTVTSTDTKFRKMEVYLQATFDSGVAWTTNFMDENEKSLPGNIVALERQGTSTVKLAIFCTGVCTAGDTNVVKVYGKSDPRWYPGGSGNTCGSSDCETDTNPASGSDNMTNTVTITLTARTGGSHSLTCETAHDGGDNVMYQSNKYLFKYELENTGWNTDTYNFDAAVEDAGGQDQTSWTVIAGLSNSKELTGQSDTTTTAVHKVEALMDITPAATAKPGVYTIALDVTSNNAGNVEGCEVQIVIPEPDLEVLVTDISFSHSSAWINARGDSQRVTITATVRNNGGTVDAAGTAVENVEVVILVDGSQLGSVQTITALGHDEEKPVSAFWNPTRAHSGDEVGIPIKISVDPDVVIKETDTDNNIASTHFKVVQTKASNPSFYMSFLSLIGAVGAAVLMSAYYRNKDSEE